MKRNDRFAITKSIRIFTCLVFFSTLTALVGSPPETSVDEGRTKREVNIAYVEELYEQHREQYGRDADRMVERGLLADREKREVHIWGEAIGMSIYDPVEFPLIAENSGHDYEALAISFARPLAIHRALEFIGMRPGRPVNYDAMQMWPKGERVQVTFSWVEDDVTHIYPVEELLIDVRTTNALPVEGFSFVGSIWFSPPDANTTNYAANAFDPMAIMSDYNERLAVLDVPYKAVDSEVYGTRRAHPDRQIPSGALVNIVMTPEYPPDRKRVMDLNLEVKREEGDGVSLRDLSFSLTTDGGKVAARGTSLANILAAFERLKKEGKDPFVSVRPDASLPVEAVRNVYRLLQELTGREGIRIEPPEGDHLFYKAFIPNERFREREGRPSQPWELRLYPSSAGATGVATRIEEEWKPEEEYPELQVSSFDVADPEEMIERVGADPGVPVMLVFTQPDLPYGDLIAYTRKLEATHPTIYIYLPVDGRP
jgi:hypothetical protein